MRIPSPRVAKRAATELIPRPRRLRSAHIDHEDVGRFPRSSIRTTRRKASTTSARWLVSADRWPIKSCAPPFCPQPALHGQAPSPDEATRRAISRRWRHSSQIDRVEQPAGARKSHIWQTPMRNTSVRNRRSKACAVPACRTNCAKPRKRFMPGGTNMPPTDCVGDDLEDRHCHTARKHPFASLGPKA